MSVLSDWYSATGKIVVLALIYAVCGWDGVLLAMAGYVGSLLLTRLTTFDGHDLWTPRDMEDTYANGIAVTLALLTLIFSWELVAVAVGISAILCGVVRWVRRTPPSV